MDLMSAVQKTNAYPQIKVLHEASETYPSMLEAIAEAKDSVLFGNYCMRKGIAFDQFSNALIGAANRGVKVHVLMDYYGSKSRNEHQLEQWTDVGIEWCWFRPPNWKRPLQYNKRLHKKLLIIDGETGFTGGIGVGDFWIGDNHYPKAWRDTHFQFKASNCDVLTTSFIHSWNLACKNALEESPSSSYFEGYRIAAIDSLPTHYPSLAPVATKFIELVNNAQHNIDITTAYFCPSRPIINALRKAAEKGVQIRIISNGPWASNKWALNAGRWRYLPLLKHPIHIYEYQPTKIHAKIAIFDGSISQIGSSNLNFRSAYHDQEFNLIISDNELSGGLTRDFEADLVQSKEITYSEWKRRPLRQKLLEAKSSLGRLFF